MIARIKKLIERDTASPRGRYFNVFVLISALFSLTYFFFSWYIQYQEGIISTAIAVSVLLLIVAAEKWKVPLTIRNHLFTATVASLMFYNIFLTGGYRSPVLAWSIYTPLMPRISGRVADSLLWAVITFVVLVMVFVCDVYGITFTSSYNNRFDDFFYGVVTFGILLLIVVVTFRFDTMRAELITEMQRQEAALIETRDQLQAAIQHKDEFLAVVSHELRTPMNAILGVSDILQQSETDAEKRELLHGMRTSADNLLVLINDVLDLTRLRSGKLPLRHTHFVLQHLADSIQLMYKHRAAEKGLQLVCSVDAALPPALFSDAARINQVVVNLLGNAFKFTECGEVALFFEKGNARSAADFDLRIRVCDTGIGIAPAQQQRVFESFYQVSSGDGRHYGGTGLGLSITQQIVELLNGSIVLQSEAGKGSQFTVLLPVQAGNWALAEKTEPLSEAVLLRLKNVCILLAEDSRINRLVAEKQIRSLLPLAQITAVENGALAVQAVRENTFDLVLMDMMMPVMDGLEASRQIKQLQPQLPIVALTANVMDSELEQYRSAAINGLVPKPFGKQELLSEMYRVMG